MEKNILQHILAGLQYLDDRLTRAKDSNHRCLFIIKSQNNNEQNLFLSRVIERLETKGILITKENRQKEFKKLYRAHSTLNRKINTFNHVTRLLGTTIGYAIIDCREQLEPNSLSIICESVQGGGIIIILFPDNMKQIKTYRTSNCSNSFVESRYHFLQWFHIITEKMSECNIININSGSISGIKATPRPRKLEKRKIPSNIKIDSRIYGLARTNDQIKAIKTMESLLTSHKQKNYRNVVVFRSSRGRGKSAAMGLGLVGLAQYLWKKEQRFIKIGIIAPYLENASTTLCFAEKGLTILNGSSRIERIKKNKGFKSNFASIEFYHLREVISQELENLNRGRKWNRYLPYS
ncbi:MAG: tRNA(Met) cytidine acetyltransferase TmcA domain-containing protein [Promethearchaeota archaeon]